MNRLVSAFLLAATTAFTAGCATNHPSLSEQWTNFKNTHAPKRNGHPPKGMEDLARTINDQYNVRLYSDPSQFPMSGDNFFAGLKTLDHKTVYMGAFTPPQGGQHIWASITGDGISAKKWNRAAELVSRRPISADCDTANIFVIPGSNGVVTSFIRQRNTGEYIGGYETKHYGDSIAIVPKNAPVQSLNQLNFECVIDRLSVPPR
jgi:hypothetical protein